MSTLLSTLKSASPFLSTFLSAVIFLVLFLVLFFHLEETQTFMLGTAKNGHYCHRKFFNGILYISQSHSNVNESWILMQSPISDFPSNDLFAS